MIIVTGAARTGTSLAMQSLRLMGIHIVGQPFGPGFESVEFNNRGYWELPVDELTKLTWYTDDNHAAVKVFGWALRLLNANTTNIFVVCKRDENEAVESGYRLMRAHQDTARAAGVPISMETVRRAYENNYRAVEEVIKGFGARYFELFYEEVRANPHEVLEDLARFIGYQGSIAPAVRNVDKEI